MKDILKLSGILLLVTAIAGASLSMVNKITKPRIEEQKKAVTRLALAAALPSAATETIEPIYENENILYYKGYLSADKKQLVGYAFIAKGLGYSSTIETMIGVNMMGTITGIKIMQQVETPGLGTKIEEIKYGAKSPWFQDQFIGKNAKGLAVDKDGGQIVSITGATISSRAVAKSINQEIQKLQSHLAHATNKATSAE
jgi:electron transport complex protein RnfG